MGKEVRNSFRFLACSTFKLRVQYRINTNFRVEDSERDMSGRMIDMDEDFFTPTMVQHKQERARPFEEVA